MRTGAEYRRSLRDGRRVWILGEGPVDDIATHPATAPLVDVYAAWYDRHADPAWQAVLLDEPDAAGTRSPLAFEIPACAEDLRRLGKAVHTVALLNAGNITHTPGYGAMIALGIVDAVKRLGVPAERVAAAEAYRNDLARRGRFITFAAGVPPPADRFRAPDERQTVRVVKETAAGVVVRGMVGNHTSVPFVDEVFVSGGTMAPVPEQRVWFAVPVAAPGVQVIARKVVARHPNPFIAPLSSRFDELDGQLWLDDVLIPWERVFALGYERPAADAARHWESIATWLFWHQQLAWLAHAEFTLGLALAVAEAMGLKGVQGVVDQLVDLVIDVQTIRSCVTAAELDPIVTPAGYIAPNVLHLSSASIYNLRQRQRMTEILRNLSGQAGVLSPANTDLADERLAAGLELAFGGGGYTALQRSALMQLVWDHVASGLDGRQAAFETHANGGLPAWRQRMQRWFERYSELANGTLCVLDLAMPALDLDGLRDVAPAVRVGGGAAAVGPHSPPSSLSQSWEREGRSGVGRSDVTSG